jgi:hypothetical protein
MKEEKQEQENYFALRLGRRHHPPLLQCPPPLINFAEVERWMKANAYEETSNGI